MNEPPLRVPPIPNDAPEQLGLTFANTMAWHASTRPRETLHTYDDLLTWSLRAGAVRAGEAQRLRVKAQHQPGDAEKAYRHGIELREAVYRMFSAHANGGSVSKGDLRIVNAASLEAFSHARLVLGRSGYQWTWAIDDLALKRPLWAIAWSTVHLLTRPDLLLRVGQCADDRGCGWLFLDQSKNHTRRWCDINDCGNRAKQRRHHQKLRQTPVIAGGGAIASRKHP